MIGEIIGYTDIEHIPATHDIIRAMPCPDIGLVFKIAAEREVFRYLYSMITTADQEPGADAQARFIQLRAQLDDLISDLERLQRTVTDREDGGA